MEMSKWNGQRVLESLPTGTAIFKRHLSGWEQGYCYTGALFLTALLRAIIGSQTGGLHVRGGA